jgi:hypothetical protein
MFLPKSQSLRSLPVQNVARPQEATAPAVVDVNASTGKAGTSVPNRFICSIVGSTTVTKTVYLFNNDILNAALAGTDIGGTQTYNDGASGKVYNKVITLADAQGPGVKVYGFNISAKDATSGDGDSDVFDTLNMTLLQYTGNGDDAVPTRIDLSAAARNTANKDGLLTVKCEFYITALSQIKLTLAALKNLNVVLVTEPGVI